MATGPPTLIAIGHDARPLAVSHMRRLMTLTRPIRLLTAFALAGALALTSTVTMAAEQPTMGTAANYAVMGATAITNTGPTVVNGNMAISPGGSTSVTGFPPGVVNGELDAADADAVLAQTDLVGAYNDAAAETTTVNLTGTDLGGLTLTPGTYTFDSSAQLTGTLTLDGGNDTNAVFIFQIGSTLTTASNSTVALINGAGACAVYWQVASSATLGTTTNFQGTIMAMTSITMNTGATIGVGGLGYGGRALAMNGAVTLDSNIITPPTDDCAFAAAPTPTPVPVPTATPSPVATAAPTTAPSSPPSAAPSSPASVASSTPAASEAPAATIISPAPGSTAGDTPTAVTTVPLFNVPGISLFPGLPDLPDTRMAGSPETIAPMAALLALAGLVALGGLSMKLVTSRGGR